MKKYTIPIILGILSALEIIIGGSIGFTWILWIGYGLYKFLKIG